MKRGIFVAGAGAVVLSPAFRGDSPHGPHTFWINSEDGLTFKIGVGKEYTETTVSRWAPAETVASSLAAAFNAKPFLRRRFQMSAEGSELIVVSV